MITRKVCYKCKRELPLTNDSFSIDKRRKDGLSSLCKQCKNIYNKKYKENHKEESKEYYRENRKTPANHNKLRTLHQYIKRHKSRPEICPICNEIVKLQLSSIDHTYTRDIEDWQWLCQSCHHLFDSLQARGGKVVSSVSQDHIRKESGRASDTTSKTPSCDECYLPQPECLGLVGICIDFDKFKPKAMPYANGQKEEEPTGPDQGASMGDNIPDYSEVIKMLRDISKRYRRDGLPDKEKEPTELYPSPYSKEQENFGKYVRVEKSDLKRMRELLTLLNSYIDHHTNDFEGHRFFIELGQLMEKNLEEEK